jgi:hypothetical protein
MVSARIFVLRLASTTRALLAAPSADLLRQRDERLRLDDRNDCERLMGDPPKGRSALDRRKPPIEKITTISASVQGNRMSPELGVGATIGNIAKYG